jgi:hypothetical protein
VRVKALLARPILVDLRNIYPIEVMKGLGFRYVSVGRGFDGEGEAFLNLSPSGTDRIRQSSEKIPALLTS